MVAQEQPAAVDDESPGHLKRMRTVRDTYEPRNVQVPGLKARSLNSTPSPPCSLAVRQTIDAAATTTSTAAHSPILEQTDVCNGTSVTYRTAPMLV